MNTRDSVVIVIYAVVAIALFPAWWLQLLWGCVGLAVFAFTRKRSASVARPFGVLGLFSLAIAAVVGLVFTPVSVTPGTSTPSISTSPQ